MARRGTTRWKGDRLEHWTLVHIKEIYPNARLSKNSGAVNADGDIINAGEMYISCKNYGTEGFTISKKDWESAENQAIERNLDPVMFIQNKSGKRLVVIDAEEFINIITCLEK